MAGKLFLEKLLLKLKTGNSRSIHLNALPGRFARLDLHEFVNLWQGLHLRFINDLLNKTRFRFSISIDPRHLQSKSDEEKSGIHNIATRLNSLFYQQQDEFLEHGTRTFALGYPLLIMRDARQPSRILKAPLIIWYLDLQKDLHQINTWTISRNEDSPVLFNEVLRAYLETHERIALDDVLNLFDEEGITEQKLSSICAKMLEKLATTPTELDLEVKVLPGTNREGIEKFTQDHPWIRWSGIFGLYRTQKQSIIKDVEQFLADPGLLRATDPGAETAVTPIFSAVPTDPSQEFILSSLRDQNKIIIQGPPGTGKSQSLTAIITDALYHHKTCLVVCEKKTALDVIHANLEAAGLSEHCIIIEDVHRDRNKVVERVRHLLEIRNHETADEFRHHEFEEVAESYERLKSSVAGHLRSVNATCFGDDSIADLAARIRKLEMENKFPKMEDGPVIFREASYKKFRELLEVIGTAEPLFAKVGHNLPFDQFHDRLFDEPRTAQRIFPEIRLAVQTIEVLLETLSSALRDHGELFNDLSKWNDRKLWIGSLFSARYKNIVSARRSVLTSYPELCGPWNDHPFLEADHLPILQKGGRLDVIELPLRNLLARLKPLLASEAEFDNYLPWRCYKNGLAQDARTLLERLSRLAPPKQWKNAFTHSYLSEFIRQFSASNDLEGGLPELIHELEAADSRLMHLLPGKINHERIVAQNRVLRKRTISGVKHLYNLRRNKTYGRRNSLRKMIHQDVELFTAAFPVVLGGPTVCSSIFPLQAGLFDQVIFDEASQLRLEDTFAALFRGKTRIISGDKHQMPPSGHFAPNVVLMDPAMEGQEDTEGIADDFLAESNSLLEYGMDSDFRNVFLDFHYRSRHPDLIDFSNSAFYGNRLVPMPAENDHSRSALEYYPVNGTYTKNRTNPEEAAAIAEYVYSGPGALDKTPSVGIATFNINQRNLIWDLLLEATFEDPAKAAQLDRLLEKGLFVKNLENIQGDERDIMLISTTFGRDDGGGFRQQFGPLTRSDGYRLLNVIITRARDKMVVFTSIPSEVRSGFASMIEEKGLTGNAVFYSWLAYVEATAAGRSDIRRNILELMDRHCIESPFLHESKRMPLFHQLIYTALMEVYGKDRTAHNFRFGGFILDLAILEGGRPLVAISTNHMKQQTATSYKMFLFKPKILKQYGVEVYTADVLDWHADWEGEFRKLTDLIDAAGKP